MLRILLATALALLLSAAQADDLPLPGDTAPERAASSSSKPHAKPARADRPPVAAGHSSTSGRHGKRPAHAGQRQASRSAKAAARGQVRSARHSKLTTRHAGKTAKKTLKGRPGKHTVAPSVHARKKQLRPGKATGSHRSRLTGRGKPVAHVGNTLKQRKVKAALRARHPAKSVKPLKSARHLATKPAKIKPGKTLARKSKHRR